MLGIGVHIHHVYYVRLGEELRGEVLVWQARGPRVVVVISLKEKELILKRYQSEWGIACL